MENDYDGITNNSGHGQYKQPPNHEEKIKAAHGESGNSPDGRNIIDERASENQPEEIKG